MESPDFENFSYDEPVWYFPFDSMEVGDSFFVPTMRPAYMTTAIEEGAKRAKVRVKAYTVYEDGILGIRTWRLR